MFGLLTVCGNLWNRSIDPVPTMSVMMAMPRIWTASTKQCLVVDMSGKLDQTSNPTLISHVRTCITGWITSRRQKESIYFMFATASLKYTSVHIWWTAMIPSLEPCMNSIDAIVIDVQTAGKTRTIWVRRSKCMWSPRKILQSQRLQPRDHLRTGIQVMREIRHHTETVNWTMPTCILPQTSLDYQKIPHSWCPAGWQLFWLFGSHYSYAGWSSHLLWRNATPRL